MSSMLNAHFQEGLPAKCMQRKKIEHSCKLNEPCTTSIRTSYQKTIQSLILICKDYINFFPINKWAQKM